MPPRMQTSGEWFVAGESGVKWIHGNGLRFAIEKRRNKIHRRISLGQIGRGERETEREREREYFQDNVVAISSLVRGQMRHFGGKSGHVGGENSTTACTETRLIFVDGYVSTSEASRWFALHATSLNSHVVARNFKESNTLAECLKFPRSGTRVRLWKGLLPPGERSEGC